MAIRPSSAMRFGIIDQERHQHVTRQRTCDPVPDQFRHDPDTPRQLQPHAELNRHDGGNRRTGGNQDQGFDASPDGVQLMRLQGIKKALAPSVDQQCHGKVDDQARDKPESQKIGFVLLIALPIFECPF